MTSKYGANRVDLADHNTSWSKVVDLVPRGARVLDVGCSTGYLGEILIRERGAAVTGIELDSADAAQARERGLDPVLEGDLDHFDWEKLGGDRFDVIVFADVLEHLRAPQAVLEACAGLLQAGGRVAISVPNVAHMSVRVELMEGAFVYERVGILDDTHTRYFTKATLLAMVRAAGLHPRRIDATLYDLPADLVRGRLAGLGLSAGPRFDEVMSSEEARAYQWFVVAEPAEGPLEHAVLPEKLVMPHARLVAEHAAQARDLEEERGRAAELRNELNVIEASRAYRLSRVMAAAYRFLRRR